MPSSNITANPKTPVDASESALQLDLSAPVSADEMMSQEEISTLLASINTGQPPDTAPPPAPAEPEAAASTAIAEGPTATPIAPLPSSTALTAEGMLRKLKVRPLILISGVLLFVIAGFCIYLAVIFSMPAAIPDETPQKTRLNNMGIRYLPDEFVKYAGRGSLEITGLFLESGMSPDAYRPSDGFTPLMSAASFGRLDMLSTLINRGATLDATDKEGQTALMKAIYYNRPQAAALLLEAGANHHLKDLRGRTAAALALEKQDPQMLQLLTQAGVISAGAQTAPASTATSPAKQQTAPAAPSSAFTLASRKAGPVQIGQTVAALYKQYDEKNAIVATSHTPYPNVKVYLDGRSTPSLIGSISVRNQGADHLIDGIRVYDERFKTAAGIGINSTLGDLRKTDGFSSIRYVDQSLFAIAKGLAFELAISLDTLPTEWLETGYTGSLSDDIKIQSIIVR